MGYYVLYDVISQSFSEVGEVGLLGRLLAPLYIFFHILAKERSKVLRHLLGFLWCSVLDGVFSLFNVISSCLMYAIPFICF